MVVSDNVVRVSDPEACWGLVSIEDTPGSLGEDRQIAVEEVLRFNSVFNEEGVTHHIVSHIVKNSQILYSVDGQCSVVRTVEGVSTDIRIHDSSNLMEMNRVSSNLESLSDISEFDILNLRSE